MWIKWKYNDHGHPDFKEAEIPDDLDGYESVEDYICEQRWVPTWSERFMSGRIKWEKIKNPFQNFVLAKIVSLKASIAYDKKELKRYQGLISK